MSGEPTESRELARWAVSGRPRRRIFRGLVADVRTVMTGEWSQLVHPQSTGVYASSFPQPGVLNALAPRRWLARLAPTPQGVTVEGPLPTGLPGGPVILVANHPTASAADLVLSRLDPQRRARTLVVTTPGEHSAPLSGLLHKRVRVDFAAPGKGGVRLGNLLGAGWSALIFPEGLPSDGATKRPFHAFASALAAQTGLPLVPVGIRGARAVGVRPGKSRVSVRFGDPLPAGADVGAQEAAVNGLIAEDRATWWAVERAEPGHLPTSRTPDSAPTWRQVWAQTERPKQGGVTETPRIWRSSR